MCFVVQTEEEEEEEEDVVENVPMRKCIRNNFLSDGLPLH
jgi:hypothetical protein